MGGREACALARGLEHGEEEVRVHERVHEVVHTWYTTPATPARLVSAGPPRPLTLTLTRVPGSRAEQSMHTPCPRYEL